MRDDGIDAAFHRAHAGAQRFDVRVDRALHASIRFLAAGLHELFTRENAAGMCGKGLQHAEFVARECQRGAEIHRLAAHFINHERQRL